MAPVLPESPESALKPELTDIADRYLEAINHRLILDPELCPKRQSRLSLVLQFEFWQGAWQVLVPQVGYVFRDAAWSIRFGDDPLSDEELDAAQSAGRAYAERLKSIS